ncbi:FtsH protease activity modulator HflK [Desulfosediminicola flagellatus]|uniref:FtsH protease activity modulator HflK n=1 Tax=Desulfosediminicola flagellatus TaxID=2569541 RepID=UPI0010AD231B|nr:FtsH protease activity modulator HflK [Desulfosediminicola flagellatus]
MSMQDQQPPWGRKKGPQTPEEMVAQLIKKLQDFFSEEKKQGPGGTQPPKKPSNPFAGITKFLAIAAIFLLLQGAFSSVFKIQPGEVGVILTLGKYSRTTQSGLHFKLPYVESLYKVNVEEIQKQEFGFRTRFPGQQSTFDRRNYDMESLMLTADKNVINVAWIVQYKISDPYLYLFKIKDVKQAVHDASESVTRRIVGNMDFDYVLSNRDLLAASVKQELQSELDNLESGVALVTVQFQDINPPDMVKPAFNEVNEADQDMKRLVNEAQETYNRVIPKARGSAKQTIEEARGYASERLNDAKGQSGRFLDILKEYRNAPDVTRKRMYLESMQGILPGVEKIYVIDKDQQSPIPLLNLTGAQGLTAPQKN